MSGAEVGQADGPAATREWAVCEKCNSRIYKKPENGMWLHTYLARHAARPKVTT